MSTPSVVLPGYPPPYPVRYPPGGVQVPPPASWHSGKCCKALWDMGTPPRCGQTNKVKLLPSRRTTYAGGKKHKKGNLIVVYDCHQMQKKEATTSNLLLNFIIEFRYTTPLWSSTLEDPNTKDVLVQFINCQSNGTRNCKIYGTVLNKLQPGVRYQIYVNNSTIPCTIQPSFWVAPKFSFFFLLKIFWRTLVLFVGPLIPLFWTSGDVSPE